MLGFFSKKLTEYSNHYLDWSRVGELIHSGVHRYSTDEIKARAKIIAATAISGFLGAYFNDSEKTHCSDLSAVLVAGILGFTLSHYFALKPLIAKRRKMSQECDLLIRDILQSTKDSASKILLETVVDHIMKLSLSDDKHGRASQTWGKRLQLLTKLKLKLTEDQQLNVGFWQNDADSIIQKLDSNSLNTKRMGII